MGKPFFEPLVAFMSSGPVLAAVVEGQRVIEGFRSLAGATDPTAAAPGTIRGDLGRDWGRAVVREPGPRLGLATSRRAARSPCGSRACDARTS